MLQACGQLYAGSYGLAEWRHARRARQAGSHSAGTGRAEVDAGASCALSLLLLVSPPHVAGGRRAAGLLLVILLLCLGVGV